MSPFLFSVLNVNVNLLLKNTVNFKQMNLFTPPGDNLLY